MEEALYLKEAESTLFMRAKGHVTAVLCSDLKSKIFERLERPPVPSEVYIDLSECSYMDSTFMGLIVGINKLYTKISGKTIILVKAAGPCRELLRNLGIHRLLRFSEESVLFPSAMDDIGMKQKATAEFLLDAHENLLEISEENKKRFAVLHTVLKNRAGGDSGTEGNSKP